jgi:bifunctional non-homologous end joining protein LigD
VAQLDTYRTKRDFRVTAEPRGARKRSSGGDQFVVQKHAASRLHYDLRLEHDGVMKSWAVAKGPSMVPGEKRLAIHTEDHPIDYNTFEGTIPKGEYGGGTVMVWDRGRWIPDGDPDKAYRKGHLVFRLEGEKLRGGWHLVRMRKKPGDRQEPWLLIKMKDETARSPREPDILEELPLSVATGRTLDEITEGKSADKSAGKSVRKRAAKAVTAGATKAPAPRARESKTRTTPVRKRKAAPDTEAGSPLPDFIEPCLATLAETPPHGADWVHEIKFDGYRIQARLQRRDVQLLTRKALDWTERFPPLAAALKGLPAEQALIDGEIVSEGENGVASFSLLQQDLKDGRYDRMVYYAFDLLHLDGRDLMPLPLVERKAELQQLMAGLPFGMPLRLSEHFDQDGSVLLEHACKLALEGIISKQAGAPYRPGRGRDWIKTKCSDRQEFVIAGYAPSTVDPKAIGALILGYYKDGKLTYAGRTGTGYSHKVARELWQRLQPLRRDRPAFGAVPKEETRARNAQWVEPRIVVEADFHGWTHGDRVRQASFQGVREDKAPEDVMREVKATATKATRARQVRPAATKSRRSGAKTAAKSKATGPRPYHVVLTNPDRVYWEDVGLTKQGLADYYASVWDWIAPHVVGRVLALVRCPEGASGECFFQKHAKAGLEPKYLHIVREPDGDESISIENLDGLIALVQAGVLEIHTRGSTIDNLEACNRLVFDLDPGPELDWAAVPAAAREVRRRLGDLGLVSFLKTTGGKGLHVVVPIEPAPWDVAKPFARGIAEQMAREHPDRYVATATKRIRTGRIFVDYLRNSREATAIAPYSTRARPGATVSVPIAWEELAAQTSGNRYTVETLPQRLARLRRDPWADIGKVKQRLPDLRQRGRKT